MPYEERDQAKAIGSRWDAVKKAWYVGPGEVSSPRRSQSGSYGTRSEQLLIHEQNLQLCSGRSAGPSKASTPSWTGKGHRLATVKDKRGEAAIFYRAYLNGVPNGYAENNRTKEVKRWSPGAAE